MGRQWTDKTSWYPQPQNILPNTYFRHGLKEKKKKKKRKNNNLLRLEPKTMENKVQGSYFLSVSSWHNLDTFSTPKQGPSRFLPRRISDLLWDSVCYVSSIVLFSKWDFLLWFFYSVIYWVCGGQIICLFSTEVSTSRGATSGPNKETILLSSLRKRLLHIIQCYKLCPFKIHVKILTSGTLECVCI